MGLFGLVTRKEHEKALKAIAAQMSYPNWALQEAGVEKFNLPDPSMYENQAELYRKQSWILTAVDMTAQAGALTDFSVARLVSGKEPKDIPNHEFEMLLDRPNPKDSRFEFLYATIAYWKLNGNAYWFLNRSNENAKPDELWVIPPHMIRPVPDKQMYLKGYIYYPGDGQEIPLEPWQIVHFMRFNPFSRFTGLSAIESLAMVAMGDIGMASWNTKLFKENNARLPGIIAFSDFPTDQHWNEIKRSIEKAAADRNNMLLRGVGQGGVQWLQNTISQKDMEFLQGRKSNKEEIWSVLAPGLMSMLSENATEANSRTGRAVFNELTVYPCHVMMAEKITNEILLCYPGRPLTGHFEDIRLTDKAMELQETEQYSKTHTIKEIREEKYGDDPLGDERDDLLPEQINAQSGGIQKPPEPKPSPFGNPQVPQNGEQQPQPQDKPAPENPNADLAKMERKALKKIGKDVDFESDSIPYEILRMIHADLPKCRSESAVKLVFSRAVEKMKPAKNNDAVLALAESINKLAEKGREAAQTIIVDSSGNIEAIKALLNGQQPPVVNVALPSQAAPVVNVNQDAQQPPTVVVNVPKVHTTKQTVIRDDNENLSGTITEYDYKE